MLKRLAISLSAALLVGGAAGAADNLIPGRLVNVKEARLAKFTSKLSSPLFFTLPVAGGAEDPTVNGAQVRFFDTITGIASAGDFQHTLPAAGWTALGSPPGSKGYKYSGVLVGDSICSTVYIRERVIKATCKSPAMPLNPPFQGPAGVVVGVPNAGFSAAVRYCAEFGGFENRNDTGTMKRRNAPPPPDCPAIEPTPTVTVTFTPSQTRTVTNTPTVTMTASVTNTPVPTSTFTFTPTLTHTPTLPPTATPTETPNVVAHTCVLDVSPSTDSQIQIHIAALPVPLVFGLSGTLSLAAGPTDQATCDIVSLNPVNIPAIGFVCIGPASGCSVGSRHCGPGAGPALGVDVPSDGNIGTCTSNAACLSACDAHCAGLGAGYAQLSSACTGYCSGTTPEACTNDTDCAAPPNGACNGPDALAPTLRDLCQCTCISDTAHGASDPGEFQCNLGSDLVVETGAPCNGTDVLIPVGQTCIPVTTQRATSLITDANFTPGSFVPNPPNVNDLNGLPLACATFDTSTLTGLRGVGAVNFFGSALGDLAVGLQATCN